MKNLILKSSFNEKLKMLLIAIGLLVTSLTTQLWAGWKVYYGNTTSQVYLHLWNAGSDNTTWDNKKAMTKVPGTTNVWYYEVSQSSSFNCIFCSSKNGDGKFNNNDITVSANNLKFTSSGTTGTPICSFDEDAVIYVQMDTWWNNSGCYHYAEFTKLDGTTTTLPMYNYDSYTSNNSAALSTASSNANDKKFFATIPSGTSITNIKLYRKSSNSSSGGNHNTSSTFTLSAGNNSVGDISDGSSIGSWGKHKPTSTGSVTASSTSVSAGTDVTLTPSLTSNTLLNNYKSVAYTVNTGTSGTDWTISGNTFTPLKAGTYIVTATITYNAKGFPDLTSTVAPTVTITASTPSTYYTLNFGVHSSGNGTLAAKNTSTSAAISTGASLLEGTSVTFTATPSSYYEVEGWYTNSACSTGKHDAGKTSYVTNITAATNVYVKFQPITYTITYNLDGGTNHASNPATYNYTTATITLQTPTKTGYTFLGWYTESTFVTKVTSIPNHSNGNKAFWAKWSENMTSVTLTESPSGAGTFTIGGTTKTSTSAGVTTKPKVTAVPAFGYKFSSWSKSNNNITLSSTTTNPTTVTGCGTASTSSTLTATFARTYAFVEGRFHITNASRNGTWTNTFGSGDWDQNSTRIPMEYDATNHRFYLHTYAKPTELSTQISSLDPYFYFKTSTASGSLSGVTSYKSNTSGTTITSAGYANRKALYNHSGSSDTNNANLRFNSTVSSGYAVLYFDGSNVWYELEQRLQYDANGGTGDAPTGTYGNNTYHTTNATITVPSNPYTRTGYTFAGWKVNNEGALISAGSSVTMSADVTLYAQWNAIDYTITLDVDEPNKGNTSGATTSHSVTYNTAVTNIPNLPTAANGYGLDGYYTDHNGEGTKLINGDGTWIASVDGYTDAEAKWIRDGGVTLYAYYKVGTITKLELSQSIVAPGTEITVTPTIAPLPSGTSYVCYEIQYSNGTPLPSQPEMSRSGNVVTFAAPTSSATYIVHATLRTGNSCGGGTLLSTQSATFQVAGSHTVTVQYMCGDMVIKAATEMTGKPLEWSEEFTAPTITGYTFTRWDAGDGVTIKNGSSDPVTTTTNQTIQIKAVYDGTLTAVYSKRRLIFFYNTLGWENVYVYFYKNNTYWESDGEKRGTGADQGYTWTNTPYSEGKHGQMLPISEGSSIYYFDAEAEGVNASYTTVAFTEANQHGYGYFYETKAARRDDYKSTTMPMFVPLGDQTPVVHNKTNYYNNGYWMNYPENTGYTLKIYNAWNAAKETGAVREFPFPYSADKKMPLKMDVEFNDAGTHEYWFMVYRNDGVYMGNSYEFKQGYNDEQVITGGDNKSKLITSASGNYTFTLTYHEKGGSNNYFIDVDYPIASNDYRIVYNDRVKWSSNTAHTASWYHPSDIIRQIENGATEPKKDTVSFFISKAAGADASMKFQKASVTKEGVITWSDVEGGSIDIPSSVSTSGVYNFIVSQPVEGGSISLEKAEPYTGSYYIRTDCAGSTKWDSYKATDHQMTFSDYTKAHEGYTHYYAHWAERSTNVKFVIANDYSPFVSDTLTKDVDIDFKNMDVNGTLKSDGSSAAYQDRYSANIRFMYNEQTNKLSRAYLASSTDISKKFLVMRGNSAAAKGHIFTEDGKELTDAAGGHVAGLDEYEMNFADDQNFIYETVIKANPTALIKLYAKYCGRSQEFKGDTTATFDANHAVEILGGTYAAGTKEKMRIVYDFKTNRLVCAWLPSGDITGELDINADVMIIREHQGDAQQIKFTTNESKLDEVKTVYGVMRFNRWTLNNKDKSTHDPVGDPKSQYERALYWISFPFNVNLSDVFGFGTYGEDWIIEYYDGAARAAEGYWIDSPGFWRYVWPAQRATFKLEAGKGYVLALDLDRMKDNNTNFWTNNIEQIELFFPSATEAGSIKETEAIISVAEHECTIDRREDKLAYDIDKDRTKADSHWNMIGVPSYANYGTSLTSDGSTVVTWNRTPYTQDLPFLYEWNMVDDSYTVQSGTTYPFKSMYAYMVQYHGDLYWSLASATLTPSPIVARRAYAQAPQEVEFKLELQQNEQMVDQTFVKLSDKEEVSANFNFDEDLCKEFNRGKANIYTIVETYIPVAGNILPLSEQTTLVSVGVKTSADGDYTFSMPNGTDGVGVTLIDGVTGERTNLALTDYTVSLEKGTYDQRFILEISPIEHTTTAIENSEKTDAPNNVCKKLIDGVLYIIKDGKVFDARGARLQ